MLTNYKTSHRANIFSAKFLPCCGDTNIISCSGDGIILFTDLLRPSETQQNQFNCHVGTTYEIATVPNDPHTFLSCGEDYTVRCYDLRIKEKCSKPDCKDDVLVTCQRAVTALTVNNVMPYQMAIGCSDSTVRLYDRRMLGTKSAGFQEPKNGPRPLIAFTAPGMEDRSYRITSLGFSPEGDDVLVSYSSEHLYMFNIKDHLGVEFEPSIEGCKDNDVIVGIDKPTSGFPPVRRLRLRGDWSDTGPDARPEREARISGDVAQARPTLHATLMQRMTDVLSRMLNDPATRAALSHGGEEDTFSEDGNNRPRTDTNNEETPERGVVSVAIEGLYQNEAEAQQVTLPPAPEQWASSSETPFTQPTTSAATDETVSLPSFESTYSSFSLVKNSPQVENSPSTSASTSTSNPAPRRDESLTSLSDQLYTMRHGFIEKHGTEPVVNLTYSDKGSTAARISMSVADEVNREQVTTETSEGSSSEVRNDNIESLPEVSSVNVLPQNNASESEAMSEGDEDYGTMDSDEDMEITDSASNNDNAEHMLAKMIQKARTSKSNSSDDDDDYVKVRRPPVKMKFTGHRNARTMIKEATFWGNDYVLSGSDCGHVFIWDRYSAKLVMLLEADHHVVNCIQPHPYLPMLATSGIDYDVKLWAPIQDEPCFDTEMAEELMKRNEVMLEETKDTITVPASFMIRMLACLNQIRRGGTARQRMRRRDANREGGSE